MSPLSDKFLIINTLHFIPFSLIKNACLQNLSESYGNLKCQVNWKHWHGTFVNYVSLMTNLCQTCMGFASVNRWEDYEVSYLFCLFCFMWNKPGFTEYIFQEAFRN